jgi:response regulator RpfG family c-di-GMP phosphodiesterase
MQVFWNDCPMLILSLFRYRYKFGSTFMHVVQPVAAELIEKDSKFTEEEIERLSNIAEECAEEMKKLKVELYAKFGNNISECAHCQASTRTLVDL